MGVFSDAVLDGLQQEALSSGQDMGENIDAGAVEASLPTEVPSSKPNDISV